MTSFLLLLSLFLPPVVNCKNAIEVYAALEKNKPVTIRLTGDDYVFYKPLLINKSTTFTSNRKDYISIHTVPGMEALFIPSNNAYLKFVQLKIDGSDLKPTYIISPEGGKTCSISMDRVTLHYVDRNFGTQSLIHIAPEQALDTLSFKRCDFGLTKFESLLSGGDSINTTSVKYLSFINNTLDGFQGALFDIHLSNSIRSTAEINDNLFTDCDSGAKPFIWLTGVQRSTLFFNSFTNCNLPGILIRFLSGSNGTVQFTRNMLSGSGKVEGIEIRAEDKNIYQ